MNAWYTVAINFVYLIAMALGSFNKDTYLTNDLEQQCEDALFELCDARERYPLRCADEFEKCIKLKTDVHMMKVKKFDVIDKSFPSEHDNDGNLNIEVYNIDNDNGNNKIIRLKHFDHKLHNIIKTLDNLKEVMNQIEREKICPINKLLQD